MPEPKTVKNRVHLDVYTLVVDDLVALGAEVDLPAEESGFAWTTMRDPEGNEFCAFVRDELPDFRIHGIVVDSADPERVATWWSEALGAELSDNAEHGGGWWTLLHATPDDVLTMDFVPVPEPKTVKNRVHWDLVGDRRRVPRPRRHPPVGPAALDHPRRPGGQRVLRLPGGVSRD